MVSKFFIGLGLAIWASIVVPGYFLLKALWDLDIGAHPTHGIVIGMLGLLWVGWLLCGGMLGLGSIVEGLED